MRKQRRQHFNPNNRQKRMNDTIINISVTISRLK